MNKKRPGEGSLGLVREESVPGGGEVTIQNSRPQRGLLRIMVKRYMSQISSAGHNMC